MVQHTLGLLADSGCNLCGVVGVVLGGFNLKLLSLFSGAGLGDLGWMMAGMEIVGQVEIDDYCQKILALRFPESHKWKDIKSVKGKEIIKKTGAIDIVAGGFPCQDLSCANHKWEGLKGVKSGLWYEYYRIICELRPRFIVVENVPTLSFRGLGELLRGFYEIGYDAEWATFPASIFGAPHLRQRIWVIAYPMLSGKQNGKAIFKKERDLGKNIQLDCKVNWAGIQINRESAKTMWEAYPGRKLCRVDDRMSDEFHRLAALGNSQVPACTAFIGSIIMEHEKHNQTE